MVSEVTKIYQKDEIKGVVKNCDPVALKDPNVVELPEKVKQLVSKGSKEAISTNNGTCLIGTVTLHITRDLDQTEATARNLNTHIAYCNESCKPCSTRTP